MRTLAEYYNENPLTLNVNDLDQGAYFVTYDSVTTGESLPIIQRVLLTITGDPDNGDFAGKKVEVPFFLTDSDGLPKQMAVQQYKRFLLVILGAHYTENWEQDNENLKDKSEVPLKLIITKRDFKGRELTNFIFEYNHDVIEFHTTSKDKNKAK